MVGGDSPEEKLVYWCINKQSSSPGACGNEKSSVSIDIEAYNSHKSGRNNSDIA